VRAIQVADVRDRLTVELRRCRHAPAGHDELAFAICSVANDRRELIGEDAREERQIAGAIVPRAKPVADGRLAFGQGVEITHVGTRISLKPIRVKHAAAKSLFAAWIKAQYRHARLRLISVLVIVFVIVLVIVLGLWLVKCGVF
jgi:hypothetical protein